MTIDVTNLTVTRGVLPVLSGVSFSLAEGEALVLRGPNGVGKTTLLRTVAGLQPPLDGEVNAPSDSFAYAGHADGLKATLTVSENLTFWADVFGTKDVSSALAAFELAALTDRPAGMLSAGQKRRLGLARLLVTGRPVWILDEPTVSLDVDAVEMFAAAIRSHLSGGGSALMATHIDLGLQEARLMDVTPFRAKPLETGDFDEAFL